MVDGSEVSIETERGRSVKCRGANADGRSPDERGTSRKSPTKPVGRCYSFAMRYLLAMLLPPLAMLLCGKFVQATVCLVLCLTVLGWLPAAIWSLFVVSSHKADVRAARIIRAIQTSGRFVPAT